MFWARCDAGGANHDPLGVLDPSVLLTPPKCFPDKRSLVSLRGLQFWGGPCHEDHDVEACQHDWPVTGPTAAPLAYYVPCWLGCALQGTTLPQIAFDRSRKERDKAY